MTSRERVNASLNHVQPDKIALDFCGHACSGINVDLMARLRDYYGLEKKTVTAWDTWQRQQLSALRDTAGTDTPMFSDFVTVRQIQDHVVQKTFSADLTAYRDHFTLGDTVILPGEIEGAAIFSRNTLTAHVDAQYEIRGAEDFCALKYLYLFDSMKKE